MARLRSIPKLAVEAEVFRARAHLARQEFGAARAVVEAAIANHPHALSARVILADVLLLENRDFVAAERALRVVLEIAPNHAEARKKLHALLRQQGRTAE